MAGARDPEEHDAPVRHHKGRHTCCEPDGCSLPTPVVCEEERRE